VVDDDALDHPADQHLAWLGLLRSRLRGPERRVLARADLEREQREGGEERPERGAEHPARRRLPRPGSLSRGIRD